MLNQRYIKDTIIRTRNKPVIIQLRLRELILIVLLLGLEQTLLFTVEQHVDLECLTCERARTPELSSKLTPAAVCSTVNKASVVIINRAQGNTPRDISDVHLRKLYCDFLYVSPASSTESLSKFMDHWSIFVKALSSTT